MHKNSYKLALFSNSTSSMHTFNLSRTRIILFTVLLGSFLGIFIYSTGRILAHRQIRIAMSEVVEENRALRVHLDDMSERMLEVDRQVTNLAQSDDQLRVMADMPKIDQDVREVGIGGDIIPRIDYNDEDHLVSKLIFDFDKLEREIRLQRQSFVEIERQFTEKEDLLLHTPSIRPVESGYISSGFGRRRDPFTRRWTHHSGIDFSLERGAPVYATAEGKVVFCKSNHGFGKVIVLDHGYGFRTAYGHLGAFSVAKGQQVKRGQKIGEVGNTGRSTGPHLHYEVHVDGKAVDALDYFFEGFAGLTYIP